MTNLLNETLEDLATAEKTVRDVAWVGSRDGKYSIGWNEFSKIADFDYCSGYGAQEIAKDLVVVGEGWWLERHEYDGSECWNFKVGPARQLDYKSFDATALTGGMWTGFEENIKRASEA